VFCFDNYFLKEKYMSFYSDTPVIFGGVSAVTATPGSKDPEVGSRVSYAGNMYVYAYNAGNSEIYPGTAMACVAGAASYSGTLSTTAGLDVAFGVVRNATMATGTYGWVLTKGFGPAYTSAAIAAGTALQPAANGLWTTGATFSVAKLLVATSAATNITGNAFFAL
jgi:hypothetical protein